MPLSWKEFKEAVEAAGVRDDWWIDYVSLDDRDVAVKVELYPEEAERGAPSTWIAGRRKKANG